MTGEALNPRLPDGVVRARLGAVVEERKATAQIILDLEKLVLDSANKCIRVRNILTEVTIGMPAVQIRGLIKEALEQVS